MFLMFHHGTLGMIAVAGKHSDRIAVLQTGQKRYSTRLYGQCKMRVIVRDKHALTDHAHCGKLENCLPLACIAMASPIAHIVCIQIIGAQIISFPRRLDFTERVSSTRLNFRPPQPQAQRHLMRRAFRAAERFPFDLKSLMTCLNPNAAIRAALILCSPQAKHKIQALARAIAP